MIDHKVETFYARIYMAGDLDVAKRVCRKFCEVGLCVNIYQTDYIYTLGEELGFCVELINYPRFPSSSESIFDSAKSLAEFLLVECSQASYTIMTPERTYWYSRKDDAPR